MPEDKPLKFYLDVCCLNRPFDDQSQGRIRLESEAVIVILENAKQRNWQWVSSRAVDLEVAKISDPVRRQRIELILGDCDEWIPIGVAEEKRVRELAGLGFASFDALHLACAESAGVGIFLTTDDRLVKRGQRHAKTLKLRVENVLEWFLEVTA
jgi:predicted nucleic acid-binding protein